MSKTQASLYTLAETTINTVSLGSAFAVTARMTRADIYIDFAQSTTTAPSVGARLVLQASPKTSGNDSWVEIWDRLMGTTAAESEAITGTQAAGATTLTVASTTNLGASTEWLFLRNTTLANSEWVFLVSIVANTSFTVADGITNAQTGSTVYDHAQRLYFPLDVSAIQRLRLVVDNNFNGQFGGTAPTGPTVAIQANIVTYPV